jgi:hypothetical protein
MKLLLYFTQNWKWKIAIEMKSNSENIEQIPHAPLFCTLNFLLYSLKAFSSNTSTIHIHNKKTMRERERERENTNLCEILSKHSIELKKKSTP